MMGEHPKRRRDKYNPYNIYEKDGKYFVSFKDGQGKLQRFEISGELFEAFNRFELEDVSYLNIWDRHLEQSEIWEPTLNERVMKKPETVEDIVFRHMEEENVHRAIQQLPEVQQRRIRLYFFEGLTYKQIAELEGCKHPAVVKSIKMALEKLKESLDK